MKREKLCFYIGMGMLAAALTIRLAAAGFFEKAWNGLTSPEAIRIMMFLETGRVMRPLPVFEEAPTEETTPDEPAQPVFSQMDAAFVEVKNYSSRKPDVEKLLCQPLTWQLKNSQPTVLVLHSHGSESYTKTEDYEETSKYRTLNCDYNVVSVGDRLVQVLEAGGVQVIHDRVMHDNPSYSKSYNNARASTKEILKENPGISLVVDLHRDAVENKSGQQVAMTAETDRGTVAQLMLVVGTDSNLSHENWPENMALAVKLHALLEKKYPGICRPISFRSQRFNQDLSPGALIVEVGAAGNDRKEALLAAEILGEVILELSRGTATEDSTR